MESSFSAYYKELYCSPCYTHSRRNMLVTTNSKIALCFFNQSQKLPRNKVIFRSHYFCHIRFSYLIFQVLRRIQHKSRLAKDENITITNLFVILITQVGLDHMESRYVISGMLDFSAEKSHAWCLKYPYFGHRSVLLRLKPRSFCPVMIVPIRPSKMSWS